MISCSLPRSPQRPSSCMLDRRGILWSTENNPRLYRLELHRLRHPWRQHDEHSKEHISLCQRNRYESSSILLNKRHIIAVAQMKTTIDGFRLILIGDLHEQPMLQLDVKPFTLMAKDWSSGVSFHRKIQSMKSTGTFQFQASAALETQINYWNLTNSHWEPCKII